MGHIRLLKGYLEIQKKLNPHGDNLINILGT